MKKNILISFMVAMAALPIVCQSTTITLFSHGIADTWKQVHWYIKSYTKKDVIHHNERVTIHTPFASFNYPDATDRFYRVNYHETSFGQENEIGRLAIAYEKTLEHFGDCDIILYGLSRGASNVAIFAGLYELTNVKAIVLESPYLAMADVITDIMIKKHLDWLPLAWGQALAELIFRKYDRNGHSPATCIDTIPKDIPIFIICSEQDHLVPASSSINFYKKLVEAGHQHVYIFVTQFGKHAAILRGPDGEKYEAAINAFYKKYNLPHCPSSAAKGEQLLALCQPQFN
jgi:pimeloyl-ACP methyl ester carboxylesterase